MPYATSETLQQPHLLENHIAVHCRHKARHNGCVCGGSMPMLASNIATRELFDVIHQLKRIDKITIVSESHCVPNSVGPEYWLSVFPRAIS